MDKYLLAIQENVCSICVDSSENGKCLLSEVEICAVEKFLPHIIKVVHSIESENVDDYINSLRMNVCSHCRTQGSSGYCYLKEDSNCSLDRYFPVIVETIKRIDKKYLI